MPPAILTIHHAVPPYAYSQMSTYENFFRHFFEKNHRARAIFENSQIETRHSVLTPDFYRQKHTIDERNRLYVEGACRLGAESIQGCLEELSLSPEDLDHFIVVSCTGYSNPGLEILIAKQLGMRRNIRRTSIVGMGCYAAFPGLARAFESVVTRPKTRTLLLAVEICSVTLQKDDSMENVVASALFADGAAAVVLGDHKNSQPGLPFPHLLDFETLTDYETVDDMGFFVTHSGFRIVLSAKIPSFIRQNIKNVVSTFLDRNGLSSKEVRFWAVHPGGGKILDYVQEELKLSDNQMAFSRHILSTHGNMSSPTVLFILDEIARRGGPRPGDFGMMLGFGPGLTIETCLIRW